MTAGTIRNMASSPSPQVPAEKVVVRPGVASRVARNFWRLSWGTKLVLTLALLGGLAGVAGSVAGSVRPEPPAKVQAQATVEELQVPAGQSLTPQQQVQLDDAKQQVTTYAHWFYDKTAPTLWRVGLGFVMAFILGYMARTFVKTVAFFAAAVLCLATAAAYFGFIDLAQYRNSFTSSTGWAMDQANGFKDLLMKSASASLSGVIGFVVGFLRK